MVTFRCFITDTSNYCNIYDIRTKFNLPSINMPLSKTVGWLVGLLDDIVLLWLPFTLSLPLLSLPSLNIVMIRAILILSYGILLITVTIPTRCDDTYMFLNIAFRNERLYQFSYESCLIIAQKLCINRSSIIALPLHALAWGIAAVPIMSSWHHDLTMNYYRWNWGHIIFEEKIK